MSSFLKIVDHQGDMHYFNPLWIVSIRPVNRRSFRDSGAEVKVSDGTMTKSYFTERGEATNPVVDFLGVEEH